MDTLNRYREIVEQVLTAVARLPAASPGVADRAIFDRKADSSVVIALGWERARRPRRVVIHLEIINGKVWIQEDNTDVIIAEDLELAGIPKSDIVLGFHPADVRPHTGYAVG